MQEHRLLIVEDESIVAMDVERRLQKLGYNVVGIAAEGNDALRLARENLPDLILMDINIRGPRDGIDIATQIHDTYRIPVIFLTAFSEDATLNRAREALPYGYVLKPFSERDLHASIQMALERCEHDRELAKSEAHFRLALDAANLGTWELDDVADPILFGYMPSGVLQRIGSWDEVYQSIIDSDREEVNRHIEQLRSQRDVEVEVRFQITHQVLGQRWMALYGKTFPETGAHRYRAVGVIEDITERKQTESRLQQAAMVYQCSAEGIVILNTEKKVISANRAFYDITGYGAEEVVTQPLAFLDPERLGAELSAQIWMAVDKQGSWQGEVRGYCKNGELIYAWMNIASVPNSFRTGGRYVVVFSDITAVHDAQEKLSHIAYYDTLTNLPNRNLFLDRLDHALARANREGSQLALFFIDLDHFKRVNDTLGHQVGDLMLRSAAQRLKTQLRENDTLCRIGGDEFIVIVEDIQSEEDVRVLAEKLLRALEKPLKLGVVDVIPSGSVGISLFPEHAQDRNDLIKMADSAMYDAKNRGRNGYSFYSQEMTDHTVHYLVRERELRIALERDQFLMYFQPQFSASSGLLVGLEGLIRWQHPEKGLLAAGEIIPIAEGSSLIVDIGQWVIRAVCHHLQQWLQAGFQPPRVAINVSVRQLESRNFVHFLMSCLAEYGVSAELIELEITESCLQESELVMQCLGELQAKGMTISIDDFGTGFSCMSSLKTLPIHKLKIDQSFVRDIPDDESDCAIAAAITALGNQLKLTTIAEGIENEQQAEFMRSIGCDELQGYLLGRPMAAAAVETLLANAATSA